MRMISTTVFSDGPGGGNPAPVFLDADTMTPEEMQKAAAELNFEAAAELRDKMLELRKYLRDD